MYLLAKISVFKRALLLAASVVAFQAVAQNMAINTTGNAPNSKTVLDISSSNMGFLLPRLILNTSTDPVSGSKPEGLMVFNSGGSYGSNSFYYWDASGWTQVNLPSGTTGQTLRSTGTSWASSSALYNSSSNIGISTTDPRAVLNVYESSESVTQTDFTQSINNSGILITSDFTDGAYAPGIFWSTHNDNNTKPKAGIYLNETSDGSKLILGTSTDYNVGIGNNALTIDDAGNIGINTLSPASALDINGNTYLEDGLFLGGTGTLPADFIIELDNASGKDGMLISSGGNAGDIGLRIEDQDGSFNIMDIEVGTGYTVFGETYSWTLSNRGVVYGIDSQDGPGNDGDFNTQSGVYRQAGVEISPYNIGGGIVSSELTGTSTVSTISSSYTTITGMTSTPEAGTYMVSFSASGVGSTDDQEMQVSLYKNGSKVSQTENDYGFDSNSGNSGSRFSIYTQALVTLNGSQAIEARYKTNTGTFEIYERSMILVKVSD